MLMFFQQANVHSEFASGAQLCVLIADDTTGIHHAISVIRRIVTAYSTA
jgi:hypothetical protein